MRKPPAYRKKTGREIAVVTLRDSVTSERREYQLGAYDSPASRETYHRIIGQWEAGGRSLPEIQRKGEPGLGITVNKLCLQYWIEVKAKKSQSELSKIKSAIYLMCKYHGSQPVADFGPKALFDLIKPMADGSDDPDAPRAPWGRIHINQQLAKIKRIIRWGVARELVPASAHHALIAVENVRRGTPGIDDGSKVRSVDIDRVEQTKPYLSKQIQALIDLQLHTGARAGELLIMRPADLDRSGDVWIYTPTTHKRAHAGETKSIPIGPKSQRMIIPFLQRKQGEFMFSPAEAEVDRTGVEVSKPNPPGDHYTIASYGRAISRACARAFPCPAGEDMKEWDLANRWTPHQLRHTAATRIRAKYGLEAAQLMLGHSSAMITDAIYAERDQTKVIAIAKDVG